MPLIAESFAELKKFRTSTVWVSASQARLKRHYGSHDIFRFPAKWILGNENKLQLMLIITYKG